MSEEDRRSYRKGPAPKKAVPAYVFPEAAEYVVFSRAKFLAKVGNKQELIECPARMEISLEDPIITEEGKRLVPMHITQWEAVGKSKLLRGEVIYRLVEGLESSVIAGSERSDLPGKMSLTGRFQTLYRGRVVDEHVGRAVGLISSFPPAPGDLFDISGSQVKIANIEVIGLTCACNT